MNNKLLSQFPALKPFVKDIWTVQSDMLVKSWKSFDFYADGSPGIMFQQSEVDMMLNQGEKRLSSLFLYGQTVKPIKLTTFGSTRVIVIMLYPHVIKTLFGIDAQELTDQCVSFEDMEVASAKSFQNQLQETENMDQQLNLLCGFLTGLTNQNGFQPLNELQWATHQLSLWEESQNLKQLLDELHVTERTFERRFLKHVGVTPRLYSRICRFQKSLNQLRTEDYANFTELAYVLGYADQSHFNRTFKEFTGLTPKQYRRKFNSILASNKDELILAC